MNAAPTPSTPIARDGVTHLRAGGGGEAVDVTLSTRRATAVEADEAHATRCSGGWTDCALVDTLRITVGGKEVEVPPRAIVLLSDLSEGNVMRLRSGRYELVLKGGDAAASYEARLFFDRRHVVRMDILSSEANAIEQSTRFEDLTKKFE